MSSDRVIRSYLMLTGIYTLAASIIWGINTLFLLDAGLSLIQVFFVNSIFTAAMAVFEIPTGVLADTRGRRASFLLSIAILLVGTVGYVLAGQTANNLGLLVFMAAVLGLGYTFYSGAMEAWLVDALNAVGFKRPLDEIFARSSMVSGAAMFAGSILGGVLGSIHLALPYILRATLLATVFVVAYRTMHEIGFEPKKSTLAELPGEISQIVTASLQHGWGNRSVRLLIVAGFVQSIFGHWGFFAWQPYFLDLLGQEAPWVAGVISALISLAMIGGNRIVQWESHRGGRRTTLLLGAAIVQTLAFTGVGLATSFWVAVPLYLLAMSMMGVWGPIKQAYIHQMIPSEQRATVISFDSLVASGASVLGQNGLGQVRNLGSGYVVGGVISILVLPVTLMLRRRKDPADFILGDAGVNSAHAAQGLPAVCQVDCNAGVAADLS